MPLPFLKLAGFGQSTLVWCCLGAVCSEAGGTPTRTWSHVLSPQPPRHRLLCHSFCPSWKLGGQRVTSAIAVKSAGPTGQSEAPQITEQTACGSPQTEDEMEERTRHEWQLDKRLGRLPPAGSNSTAQTADTSGCAG